MKPDWTQDASGHVNSSPEFLAIVLAMEALIRNLRVGDDVPTAARMIVAQLAHVHGLAPAPSPKETP